MSIKNTASLFLAGTLFLLVTNVSNAAGGYGTSNCQVIYGGGEVCPTSSQFSLDKKVQSPTKGGGFVDNLGMTDAKFAPDNQVVFKIIIKNTGEKNIDTLTITDTLPENVVFRTGAGVSNSDNKTVTYTIKNLPKGESNEQNIVVTVLSYDQLPKDQAIICLTNNVKATDNNGNIANDSAAFCIEKPITQVPIKNIPEIFTKVPPKSIPNTGPEMLPLLGLIPAGITGLFLRKKKLN